MVNNKIISWGSLKSNIILVLGSNNSLPNVPPRIVHRDRIGSNPSNLKPVDQRKAYQNNAILRQVRHSRDNIPNESLILVEIIGEGEFGTVYKGKEKSFYFKVSYLLTRISICVQSNTLFLHCYVLVNWLASFIPDFWNV